MSELKWNIQIPEKLKVMDTGFIMFPLYIPVPQSILHVFRGHQNVIGFLKEYLDIFKTFNSVYTLEEMLEEAQRYTTKIFNKEKEIDEEIMIRLKLIDYARKKFDIIPNKPTEWIITYNNITMFDQELARQTFENTPSYFGYADRVFIAFCKYVAELFPEERIAVLTSDCEHVGNNVCHLENVSVYVPSGEPGKIRRFYKKKYLF